MNKKQILAFINSKTIFKDKNLIVLKIRFKNDELTPRSEKIKTLHAIETKWDIRIKCQARLFIVFTHRKGKGINV